MERLRIKGQIIIELLVAFGLAGILLPAILAGLIGATSGKAQQQERVAAVGYLKEAEEAVRDLRNNDWANITSPKVQNGTYAAGPWYHPVSGGSPLSWSLVSGKETIGDFTRSIVFSDIGSPADPSIKQVYITVSWGTCPGSCVFSTLYLARWKNITYSPITAGGTLTGQGFGDWCNPSAYIVGQPFNLGAIPIAITATTSASMDMAYTSTGENRSSGSPVFGLNISHGSPPVVTNPFSSPDNAKAYGIYTDGQYVYFTEANPGPTVRIASAANLTDVGFFSGATKGAGTVYVAGTGGQTGAVGYVAIGSALYSFDLAQIKGLSTSQTQLDSMTLAGAGARIVVTGTNVYVATSSTTAQLQIIPSLPGGKFDKNNVKNINLGNSQGAVDLALDPQGRYLYVITNFATGKNDFFIIDLLNNNAVTGLSTHIDAGQPGAGDMNPRNLIAVTLNKVIVVGCNGDNGNDKCPIQSTGWNYQVFDVPSGNPGGSSRCGGTTPIVNGVPIPSINSAAGVSQSNGNAFSYIISGVNSSANLQIISGGAGGGAGGNGGTFESATFDCRVVSAGNPVACTTPTVFNSFNLTSFPVPNPSPAGITTSYQAAVSTDCTTFNYAPVTGSGPWLIPKNINPGYCFRYKVTFSNAGGATSASTSIQVNYSP